MSITKIAEQTLASTAASITFSSIPQTATDLMLIVSSRGTDILNNGGQAMSIYFNGSNTSLTGKLLGGDGSAASSSANWFTLSTTSDNTANTFGNATFYIPNYALSTINKSFSIDGVGENNATKADGGITAGLWSSTAAITSITFLPRYVGSLAAGTSASLYSVTKGQSGTTTVA
jgi:hypothetical protein